SLERLVRRIARWSPPKQIQSSSSATTAKRSMWESTGRWTFSSVESIGIRKSIARNAAIAHGSGRRVCGNASRVPCAVAGLGHATDTDREEAFAKPTEGALGGGWSVEGASGIGARGPGGDIAR